MNLIQSTTTKATTYLQRKYEISQGGTKNWLFFFLHFGCALRDITNSRGLPKCCSSFYLEPSFHLLCKVDIVMMMMCLNVTCSADHFSFLLLLYGHFIPSDVYLSLSLWLEENLRRLLFSHDRAFVSLPFVYIWPHYQGNQNLLFLFWKKSKILKQANEGTK